MLSETCFHPTDIHGHTVRLPSHRAIQWLRDPTFERERIRTMAQVVQPDDVVFDIGAEQGDMSALYASWVPDGGVVLVEPNPKFWPCIRATFEENGLADPLAMFVGFCSSVGGTDPASWCRDWPTASTGTIDPAAGFCHLAEQAELPSLDVDTIARYVRPPNVITIDVEGAELEVLKGAAFTLKHTRPTVFVSVHERFLRHHFGQTATDVYRFLRSHDYDLFHLGSDHEQHVMAVPM